MVGITYEDFLDLSYDPADSDLVCEFYVEPAADQDAESAASRVASESSNGTWAELQVDGGVTDLSATACGIEAATAGDREGYRVTVAYPDALFEGGNMPQILSCIAGNILGMKAVDRIRLLDCTWPEPLATSFAGPQFGTSVRSEIFDADDRPITATVPKPKVGLSTDQHAQIGYEAWTGGLDLLKDDENLTDQAFNPFEDRLTESLAQRDRAVEETGEPKSYLLNVTAGGTEMLERVDMAAEHGCEYVMVDVVTCGWAAVQQVRERCERHGLAIHAHRAMHAAFDRLPSHGVSMRVIAQIARLCGVDQIHTGTADLGKLANEDTVGINEWLTSDLYGLDDVLPMASGGLHPGLVPELVDRCGTNIGIQAGGGVHGHPDGTHEGAKALRAAVEAAAEGRSIEAAADDEPALATALDKWGTETPR
ncbi:MULTISPECIES: type III ribulose-bisphosphate carboxylase [Halomicrobium]|uniref:Ribulose bisphosphate carboxylase n=2 Tax=Halomicrobium mukohataei TaxID=57705 RepID=C7P079_HALMD|nr:MULTISPECIES: type III ribulose-bisphosphate carboxylase [Halomicrobium]ACV48871.1 ribulose bisphosphate carboxylase, type III [Halomicrobium mukohataei DSM 12286]QCD64301.1 type III ribulose-bisphosphate carboxylase [Halomicrobium mukohataei]QFR19107.1 type III ribulose-bisphosphate carboxylase [Halomicrobium sp. ZPS1]